MIEERERQRLTRVLRDLIVEALSYGPDEPHSPRTKYLHDRLIHETPHTPTYQETLNHINQQLSDEDTSSLFYIKYTSSRGFGLFARNNILLNSTLPSNIIATYNGIHLSHSESSAIFHSGRASDYAFEHSLLGVFDAACLESSNISRYINDPSPHPDLANAIYEETENAIIIKITQDINAGEEILASYGQNL